MIQNVTFSIKTEGHPEDSITLPIDFHPGVGFSHETNRVYSTGIGYKTVDEVIREFYTNVLREHGCSL